MRSHPSVSLCMIVKDEEKNLADCLRSVNRLVDEIVIVDTGSSDRTVSIAREFGACVHSFDWRDDFAAARNESLRFASGDWILYLDADERLASSTEEEAFRKALSNPSADAYLFRIVSPRGQGAHCSVDVTTNIRLFRRFPGVHFVNEVHERVEPFLISVGARILRSSFVIEHDGYALDPATTREKLRRNLRLSQEQLKRTPDDPYALYYQGLGWLGMNEQVKSRECIERALQLKDLPVGLEAMLWNLVGYLDLSQDRFDSALAGAAHSRWLIESQTAAKLISGLALYQQNSFDRALPLLLESLEWMRQAPQDRPSDLPQDHVFIDPGELTSIVATCCFHTEEYHVAAALLDRFLDDCGPNAEMRKLLAISLLKTGNPHRALETLHQAEREGLSPSSLALPTAYALFLTGDSAGAAKRLAQVRSVEPFEQTLLVELRHRVGHARGGVTVGPEQERSTVSLCMIVKDEEANLPRCLSSVKSLVDEIVVVDTGSSDGTIDLAKSWGARVVEFPWCDDFSAARNESLRHAKGDWVLFIDADEQIKGGSEKDCLRWCAGKKDVDAYLVPIWNLYSDGTKKQQPAHAIRMFRRYPGIHFVGKVHEQVEPFLEGVGARVGRSSFSIEHWGYDAQSPVLEKKQRRNMLLSEQQVKISPGSPYAWYQLAMSHRALGNEDSSLACFEKALACRQGSANLQAMILNGLAYQLLKKGDYQTASNMLDRSLDLIPRQNSAVLLKGMACLGLGDYGEASVLLKQAREFLTRPEQERLTDIHFEETIDEMEHLKYLGICSGELGDHVEAARYLRGYVDLGGGEADCIRRLGLCYLNTGLFAEAIRFLNMAQAAGIGRSELALPLAVAHFSRGEPDLAEEYFLRSEADSPESLRISLTLFRMMSGNPLYYNRLPRIRAAKQHLFQKGTGAAGGDGPPNKTSVDTAAAEQAGPDHDNGSSDSMESIARMKAAGSMSG